MTPAELKEFNHKHNTQLDAMECLGFVWSISQLMFFLQDKVNDMWCEDHCQELTEDQKKCAQEIELWCKLQQDVSTNFIQRLRGEHRPIPAPHSQS